jgi:DNA-binding NtrC family response regulator
LAAPHPAIKLNKNSALKISAQTQNVARSLPYPKQIPGKSMKGPQITILVAERNPHMRGFICRELARQNMLVRGAKNSDEVMAALAGPCPPDLVVLAFNTINTGSVGLLERVTTQHPDIPVVLHAFLEDMNGNPALGRVQGMVEKSGNPVELITTVMNVLERRFPHLMNDTGTQEAPDA